MSRNRPCRCGALPAPDCGWVVVGALRRGPTTRALGAVSRGAGGALAVLVIPPRPTEPIAWKTGALRGSSGHPCNAVIMLLVLATGERIERPCAALGSCGAPVAAREAARVVASSEARGGSRGAAPPTPARRTRACGLAVCGDRGRVASGGVLVADAS